MMIVLPEPASILRKTIRTSFYNANIRPKIIRSDSMQK